MIGFRFSVFSGPFLWLLVSSNAACAMTLEEAVANTVTTHPSVEAARANRRATDLEMLQSQGRLLPSLDLDADLGREKIDQPQGFAPDVNDQWRTRRQAGLTLRQPLFDGFDRANDIYKNAARVDAAALRVMSRAETLGLEAVEAYIDVGRNIDVLNLVDTNLRRHREILDLVRDRERGGRATRSEALQVQERIAAAEAAKERSRESLLEAKAKFRQVVGVEPTGLGRASIPSGIPTSRHEAVELSAVSNPATAAAQADADAAHAAMEQSASNLYPNIGLELRGATGENVAGTPGPDNELSGLVVMRWNLFDGMITRHRRMELAQRWQQAMAERDAATRSNAEEIDRAIAGYQTGGQRVQKLRNQLNNAVEVVDAYAEEYKASKRSLLDLLDSESARFNAEVQVTSAEALRVFSAYRLLASVGRLLASMGIQPPPEAEATRRDSVAKDGIFSVDLPPLR
jgi:adhesin transport system outer membrane protein